jgi:eukaryotic-like serine/threonine-protein kinase
VTPSPESARSASGFGPPADPVNRAWEDMWGKAARGLPFRAEDYLGPDDLRARDAEQVLDLAYAEYVVRTANGIPTSVEEYVERFPDLSERLTRQFQVHAALQDTVGPTETLIEPPAPAPVTTSALQAVGRYRVVNALGRGGQATTYRGYDPDLGRDVVIKLAHTRLVPGEQDRLAGEGRSLAGLDHPAIARVFDFGVYDGRPYLVSEFVAGRPLHHVAATTRFAPAEAARVVAQAAVG